MWLQPYFSIRARVITEGKWSLRLIPVKLRTHSISFGSPTSVLLIMDEKNQSTSYLTQYLLSLLQKLPWILGLMNYSHAKVKVTQSCLTFCDPMDYTVHGILWTRILKWVAFHFSRGSSQPRGQTQVSHIVGGFYQLNHKGSHKGSYPLEWVRKPKNTGVGSLSLLQWIFPTQELNRVSCIAGRFFPNWAMREAYICNDTHDTTCTQATISLNSGTYEVLNIYI